MRWSVVAGGALVLACTGPRGAAPSAPLVLKTSDTTAPGTEPPEHRAEPPVPLRTQPEHDEVAASGEARGPTRPDRTRCGPPPRPQATAELTPPQGGIVGVWLTVLGAPPKVATDFEPWCPPGAESSDASGVLVSVRLYRPLAWELGHGSLDGYQPGPDATDPEPSFTFSGRAAPARFELLVFDGDGLWKETVPLAPCSTGRRCPEYVSPVGSVVVIVAQETAKRLGLGKGWSIALSI